MCAEQGSERRMISLKFHKSLINNFYNHFQNFWLNFFLLFGGFYWWNLTSQTWFFSAAFAIFSRTNDIFFFSFQKSQTERHKSSDESIASSIVPQDPRRDRKFSKQRSFGFSRQSQAPSEVSVNLTPDRTSIANLDDMGVSWLAHCSLEQALLFFLVILGERNGLQVAGK